MENKTILPPEIIVRVPGPWRSPDDFAARLPTGYRLSADPEPLLITPDGTHLPLGVLPADDQFLEIFAASCQRPPSDADQRGIENYLCNLCLTMPGGSLDRAAAALRHTVALLDAGGHGVFVDNSGLAHGSDDWRKLAHDTGPDSGGPFWACVVTTGIEREIWTTGMHCLGYRDAIMPRTGDDRADDFQVRNFLAYTYRSGAVIEEGHIIGANLAANPTDPAEPLPMFRIHLEDDSLVLAGHPMHNPYGRYRLISYREGPPIGSN